MCVSVATVTRFTKQQSNTQSHIGPRNLCTKYELHRQSNSRVRHDPRSIDPLILPTHAHNVPKLYFESLLSGSIHQRGWCNYFSLQGGPASVPIASRQHVRQHTMNLVLHIRSVLILLSDPVNNLMSPIS